MEVMCFNCTAAILVCNGEHDPGRVQNLPRGSGVWGKEGGGGKKNCPPLLFHTIQPDKHPLKVVLVFSLACAQIKDQGMQSANCKQF